MANLKADIDNQLDRARKLNDKEYEILPRAWELLLNAEGLMNAAIALAKDYVSLGDMSDEQITDFLTSSGFSKLEINDILSSDERTKALIKITNYKQANEAHVAVINYKNYILINALFIDKDFKDKMIDLGNRMLKVTSTWVVALQEEDRSLFKGSERNEASIEIEKLRYSIEELIISRLKSK